MVNTVFVGERNQKGYLRRPVNDAVGTVVMEEVLPDVAVGVVQLVLPPWPVCRWDDLSRFWR